MRSVPLLLSNKQQNLPVKGGSHPTCRELFGLKYCVISRPFEVADQNSEYINSIILKKMPKNLNEMSTELINSLLRSLIQNLC